jgi:hypothetical protein
MKTSTVDDYLKATKLCDCDNEEIKRKAQELIKDATTPKEAASKIFYFIRDEVVYGLDFVDAKASHTLRTRLGDCILKSNLQIALLRAVEIPARYHRVALRKEVLQGIFSDSAYQSVPEVVDYHPYCECYLSGKWVACATLFDKGLFKAMVEKGFLTASQISTIDWDGEHDTTVVTPWVVKDYGTFASLDDLWIETQQFFDKRYPRILQRIANYFSNRHTNKIRQR